MVLIEILNNIHRIELNYDLEDNALATFDIVCFPNAPDMNAPASTNLLKSTPVSMPMP